MPKLAERYTTKYGFQCLEKNVTETAENSV